MSRDHQHPRIPVASAKSLTELPEVVLNALVFSELLLRAGFQPETITFEQTPASKFGLPGGSELVVGVLREGRRELCYALGIAVPQVDTLISDGLVLWDTADHEARDAVWDASRLTKHEHVLPLLRQIVWQGFAIPNLSDSSRPSQLRAMNPRRAAGGPGPTPACAPRFELGKVLVDDDALQQLAGIDLRPYLDRHARGDWGAAEFPEENEAALRDGLPILSVFRTEGDIDFWVTTWTERTRTTIRPGYQRPDLGPIPRDLVCRYAGTGSRAEIEAEYGANCELYSLALALPEGPTVGGLVEDVAAALGRVITDHPIARRRTANPEQMTRMLWRSVLGVDLRPLDGTRRRISGLRRDGKRRAWKRAKADCFARGIRAWFAVSYEARLS